MRLGSHRKFGAIIGLIAIISICLSAGSAGAAEVSEIGGFSSRPTGSRSVPTAASG